MGKLPAPHPLHPALAHFPLAFWVGAAASDLIALATGKVDWWTVSRCAVTAGVLLGAVTLLAGLLELWLRRIPAAAVRWLAAHAGLMFAALLCFGVSLSQRSLTPPPPLAVYSALAGCALVLAGGYFGGSLVYRFGVGVAGHGAAR